MATLEVTQLTTRHMPCVYNDYKQYIPNLNSSRFGCDTYGHLGEFQIDKNKNKTVETNQYAACYAHVLKTLLNKYHFCKIFVTTLYLYNKILQLLFQ